MILVQKPNPPLIAAGIGFIIDKFAAGIFQKIGTTLFISSLIIWSYLELTQGVNWFRKLLGAVVLISTLMNLFKHL